VVREAYTCRQALCVQGGGSRRGRPCVCMRGGLVVWEASYVQTGSVCVCAWWDCLQAHWLSSAVLQDLLLPSTGAHITLAVHIAADCSLRCAQSNQVCDAHAEQSSQGCDAHAEQSSPQAWQSRPSPCPKHDF